MSEGETFNQNEAQTIKTPRSVERFLGKQILSPVLELLEKRVTDFNIKTNGLENLAIIQEKPCLIVSNHLKPTSAIAENSQLSPDAFVLKHIVKESTTTTPKIVAKAGNGWWFENKLLRAIQEKAQPIIKRTMSAAGMVPIDKNPGSVNVEFFHEVEKTIANGDSLIIFPEGHWYSDFDSSHSLSDGAALLAIKYGLTLIPAYIHGADKWEKGTPVTVSFGEPFLASAEKGNSGRHQTTEKIRSSIAELQSKIRR